MAARHQLSVDMGATFTLPLFWYEPLIVNGVVQRSDAGVPLSDHDKPIDLTNCTARMHIRRAIGDADPLLVLTTENGGITLGGPSGQIIIEISAEQTASLASGVYDLEIVHPGGKVTRLFQGKLRVSAEVTR